MSFLRPGTLRGQLLQYAIGPRDWRPGYPSLVTTRVSSLNLFPSESSNPFSIGGQDWYVGWLAIAQVTGRIVRCYMQVSSDYGYSTGAGGAGYGTTGGLSPGGTQLYPAVQFNGTINLSNGAAMTFYFNTTGAMYIYRPTTGTTSSPVAGRGLYQWVAQA